MTAAVSAPTGNTQQALPRLMDAKAIAAAWLYVFDTDHGVKVGITVRTILERLGDIERAAGVRPVCVRAWSFESRRRAYQVEHAVHWHLRETRRAGEWFHCHPFEACDAVEDVLRNGLPLEMFQAAS